MPSDASLILGSISDGLTAIYPAVPVRVRRAEPGSGRDPNAGWQAGDPSTVFIVSAGDPEEVDDLGSFEEISLALRVSIAYVKPSPPGAWNEDSDVRDVRQAVLAAVYKPYLAGVTVQEITTRAGRPYTDAAGKTFSFSKWEFVFTTTIPRP